MQNTLLIKELVRVRMVRLNVDQFGASEAEGEEITAQTLRDSGLEGPQADLVAMSLPEGALVHMVETFMNSRADLERKGYDRQTCNNASIELIENHRKKSFGGLPVYPTNLEDYVIYRLGLEVQHQQGRPAEDIGLHDPLVRMMVQIASESCRQRTM